MDTLTTITALAEKQFGVEAATLNPDVPMTELGADSLGVLEFMFTLEEHFGISIPHEETEGIRTLRELAALIDRVMASVSPPVSGEG